ncbi:MAG: hypothetical protein ABH950_01735, partial [Candidatus Altiarchaeota archaeon]
MPTHVRNRTTPINLRHTSMPKIDDQIQIQHKQSRRKNQIPSKQLTTTTAGHNFHRIATSTGNEGGLELNKNVDFWV